MQHATESVPAKLAAAISAAFLLAAGHRNHAIVMSLKVFAAIHAGAHVGYLAWLPLLAVAVIGNIVGGTGFVTVLRLVQAGAENIKQEQARSGTKQRQARSDSMQEQARSDSNQVGVPG
jgi:formate-nitrite transporter family protein